jgi:hypothetical protein
MKYTAEKAMKVSIFKLLWAMYDDLNKDSNSFEKIPSAKDNSGAIIGWYSSIIEKRMQRKEQE